MTTLLEVKDLHVTFQTQHKTVQAVRGVSFHVEQGERLGIVGESGSGKSATVKALVKLLPSYTSSISGRVQFGKEDLATFSEKEMQRVRGKEIGMIFQDPMTSLNPTIKIGKQIVEGFRRHYPKTTFDEAYAYAIEMLELVGIPEAQARIEEYPHTLSGGMRQRVMIALALASKPKLLLADEPTTSLDVTIQAQILDLMKQLQKKTNTSILLITHDLSVVANFCDRVLVMYAGKIVESATVDELFSNPQHPYTQRLLQSIPRLNMSSDLPLHPIEGSPPDLFDLPSGCGFCPRCPYAMRICQEKDPPSFQVGNRHKSACWKNMPREVLRDE